MASGQLFKLPSVASDHKEALQETIYKMKEHIINTASKGERYAIILKISQS